jgi:hypothetical protein
MAEVMMIDGTTEIATLRHKLAAAETRIQERGRDTATEADEDNASSCSRRGSRKAKNTPTIDALRERMAALLRDLPKDS